MQTGKKAGCPIPSDEIFAFMLHVLKERGILRDSSGKGSVTHVSGLKAAMPEWYFPDVYIDLPLTGTLSRGAALVMDCYDRCRIDYTTEGNYFRWRSLPALTAPENRDDFLVIRAENEEQTYGVIRRDHYVPGEDDSSEIPDIECFRGLLKYARVEETSEGIRLIFHPDILFYENRMERENCRSNLLTFLSGLGCGGDVLEMVDRASFFSLIPYLHPRDGYQEWILCTEIAALDLMMQNGQIRDCHALLRISDKNRSYSGIRCKPDRGYQWHITDLCDQRCRHCYLFAEDAKLKCISTPWEQMLRTLDAIEEDAERFCRVPIPAITGGDPVLHPDFWRLAEELHHRGLKWLILGNPFHLNDEVCRRIYQLGCYKYQLSLDGLEQFHDSLRKPGSFQATIEAVKHLGAAGIRTQFMATATRQNLDDILKCMDVAAENQVSSFLFARYCATSPEKAREYYPSPEKYRDFLLRYYRKRTEFEEQGCKTTFYLKDHLFTLLRYELGEFVIPEYAGTHPDRVFSGCHLGQVSVILPNGDLMACRRMESVVGNVNDASISAVRDSELCSGYREIHNIRKCKDCELLQFCRGCRAVGFNVTGDLQGSDPCCWKEV